MELLATAAYLLGHVEDCLTALQRAHQLYAKGGDHRRAAWCAGWLGFHLSSRGDLAQASGWFGRQPAPEHEPHECAEQGYLLTSVAFQQLMAGDYADARATAERAAAIGGHAGDADVVAFGFNLQGRALVWDGRVGEGLALLDEAMVAVVAGELSLVVAGTVYCGTIEICQEIAELRRAQEWTEALTAWCGEQPDMVTFTGQCLVHRAEILQLHGAWPEAVEEAKRAGERFARAAVDYATGAARYRQVVGDAARAAPEGPFDLVTVFEALHDMGDPEDTLRAARALLTDDGNVLVADERVAATFDAPGDPVERFMYGWSVLHCLPATLAERPMEATLLALLPPPRRRADYHVASARKD